MNKLSSSILWMDRNFLHMHCCAHILIVKDSDKDMAMKSINPIQVSIGSVIRLQAKQLKKALNGPVTEVWVQANLWRSI